MTYNEFINEATDFVIQEIEREDCQTFEELTKRDKMTSKDKKEIIMYAADCVFGVYVEPHFCEAYIGDGDAIPYSGFSRGIYDELKRRGRYYRGY